MQQQTQQTQRTLQEVRSYRTTQGALYKGFLPLAQRFARQFSDSYMIPLDESIESAEKALADIVLRWDRFDDSKSSALTFMYTRLRYRMLDMLRSRITRYKNDPRTVQMSVYVSGRDEGGRKNDIADKGKSWIEGVLEILSGDAKVFVFTIINAPHDLVEDLLPKNKKARMKQHEKVIQPGHQLYEHFTRMGWDDQRIVNAWDEVLEAVA